MKAILFFSLAFLAISCFDQKSNYYYVRSTEHIDFTVHGIPDTMINNDTTHIILNAKQESDCWSNLNFVLSKINDSDYSLEAFGVFESFGSCSDKLVLADTTIPFKPTKTGIYRFYVVKSTGEYVIDTMIVK